MAELLVWIVALFIAMGIPLAIILFLSAASAAIAYWRSDSLIMSRVMWANVATALGAAFLYGLLAPEQFQRDLYEAGIQAAITTQGAYLRVALGGIPHLFWWLAITLTIAVTTLVIANVGQDEAADSPSSAPSANTQTKLKQSANSNTTR